MVAKGSVWGREGILPTWESPGEEKLCLAAVGQLLAVLSSGPYSTTVVLPPMGRAGTWLLRVEVARDRSRLGRGEIIRGRG